MIDDGYEEIAPGKSRNTMRLETLTRNYSDAEFTCVGTNTNDNNHAITLSTQINLNREYHKLDFQPNFDGLETDCHLTQGSQVDNILTETLLSSRTTTM